MVPRFVTLLPFIGPAFWRVSRERFNHRFQDDIASGQVGVQCTEPAHHSGELDDDHPSHSKLVWSETVLS